MSDLTQDEEEETTIVIPSSHHHEPHHHEQHDGINDSERKTLLEEEQRNEILTSEKDNWKDGVDISSPEHLERNASWFSILLFLFVDPLLKVGFKKAGDGSIMIWIKKLISKLKIKDFEIREQCEGMTHADIPKLPPKWATKYQFEIFEPVFRKSFLHERQHYSEDGGIGKNFATLLLKISERTYRWRGWYNVGLWKLAEMIFRYISPLILYVLLESIKSSGTQSSSQNSKVLEPLFYNVQYSIISLQNATFQNTSLIINSTINNQTSWLNQNLPMSNGFFQVGLVVLLFLCNILPTIFTSQYTFGVGQIWFAWKGCIQAAVFQKINRITSSERSKFQSGEITNLFTTDATRIATLAVYMHECWVAPVSILVGLTMICIFFGYSALIGVGAMLLVSPLIPVLANIQTKVEGWLSKFRDERVKFLNELLNGIRMIKFFVFEEKMKEKVMERRKKEAKGLFTSVFALSSQRFSAVLMSMVGGSVTFISYAYFGGELTVSNMFTGLILFDTFRGPLTIFPVVLSGIVSAYVSSKRVGKFLYSDEHLQFPHDHENKAHLCNEGVDKTPESHSDMEGNLAIEFENASLKWSEAGDTIISNMNLKLEKGKLYSIIGDTGSGKTTLISSIIGESIVTEGSLKVNPQCSLSLCDENPWMINSSVRNNITFDKSLKFDPEKYRKVLEVCQLKEDLEQFSNYDETEIGYSGINLSVGQRHRISLARACYSDSDIIIMDSTLNSVDAKICKKIFRECLCEFLNGKTRILLTHSLQLLEMVDEVIVIEKGKLVAKGPLHSIMHAYDFSKLISEKNEVGESEESNNDEKENTEQKSTEKDEKKGKLVIAEDKSNGTISWRVTLEFAKECGIIYVLISIISCLLSVSSKVGGQIWISIMNIDYFGLDLFSYVWIFFGIGIADALFASMKELAFGLSSLKASNSFHRKMLDNILHAPTKFFDQNPTGRILNRFTQDIMILDTQMIFALPQFISTIFSVCFTLVMISTVTPLFLIVVIPIAILFFVVQEYYRSTSREIRRLESISRSPAMSHFSSCLEGAKTIKASLIHDSIYKDNYMKIDFANKHFYGRFLINRWLAVRIQLIAQLVIFFTALFAIITKHTQDINQALLALVITYSLQLSDIFTEFVRSFVDLESHMTSVERIIHYSSNIEQEAPYELDSDPVPTKWPTKGHIEFNSLTARYRDDLEPVLNSIKLDVKPGTKIGIVGRTGSGKSTLLISLFRFIEASEGNIKIDGVDISKIGLKTLRRSLLIIPQIPILFSGTIRYNLDPFNEFQDREIWHALERVHMKEKIQQIELSGNVTENGSNFSIGERQLLSLCRCILRRAKIIIFDESTAFVDHNSDEIVQKVIREEFKDSTIITVAHRLDTIIDADTIAFMKDGQIIEIGSPKELLALQNSNFSQLVNETGKNYSAHLKKKANN